MLTSAAVSLDIGRIVVIFLYTSSSECAYLGEVKEAGVAFACIKTVCVVSNVCTEHSTAELPPPARAVPYWCSYVCSV